MQITNNLGKLIKTSFKSCTQDKLLKKYFLILAILQIISMFTALILTSTILTPEMLLDVQAGNVMTYLPSLIFYFAIIFTFAIVISLIFAIIGYLIIYRGLELVGKKPQKIDFVRFIKFIFLGLVTAFYAIFSVFNLKLFLIFVVGLILILIGALSLILNSVLGGILLTVGLLILFAYLFVIIYNLYRLIFIEVLFIEKGEVRKGLEESYNITKGNVLDIIIAFFVIGIIIAIILVIVDLPNTIYVFMIGFAQGVSGSTSEVTQLTLMSDPIYWILQIPSAVATAFYLVFINVFIVNAYALLVHKKQKK